MFLTGFAGLTHLALCSHDCRQSAEKRTIEASVALELHLNSVHYFLRASIFLSPRALTSVSVPKLGVRADAGSSLPGVGPPVVHD